MKIWNLTTSQVRSALDSIDSYSDTISYHDNVIFKREPERTGATDRSPVECTLRVQDSNARGAKHGHGYNARGLPRRTTAACFHAHEAFYRACFALGATRIKSMIADWHSMSEFEASLDLLAQQNVGSIMNPQSHGDACSCDDFLLREMGAE